MARPKKIKDVKPAIVKATVKENVVERVYVRNTPERISQKNKEGFKIVDEPNVPEDLVLMEK